MKQLLIVNSAAALNGGASTPKDISAMTAGSLGVYKLSDNTAWLAAAPTEDFAIVLGRGANLAPFVIPEVDFDTVTVNKATYKAGVAFVGEITIPTVSDGKTYTLVLSKKGQTFNERVNWTVTETIKKGDNTTTAANIAKKLGDQLQAMADAGSINVSVTVASAKITVTGTVAGEGWTLTAGDNLYGTTITTTEAEPAIGDKAYIQDLASRCAAGKGVNDTYADGAPIYPAYPETVEDKNYNVYTLRFAVGRKSAKTRDERVSQLVHIAVPSDATAASAIDTIIGGIKAPVSETDNG